MTSAIAKAIIISHVIIFGSTAYSGSYQEMECQYLLKKLDTCWERFTSLPVCTNPKDPLIDCAETQAFAAKRMDCSSEIQTDLKMFWRIYITMRESLCSNDDLYKDFINKPSCWSIVRNCSAVVAFVPTVDKVKKDECNSHLEEMQICYQRPLICTDVVHRFSASLATRTCSELLKVEFLQIKENTANRQTLNFLSIFLIFIALFIIC